MVWLGLRSADRPGPMGGEQRLRPVVTGRGTGWSQAGRGTAGTAATAEPRNLSSWQADSAEPGLVCSAGCNISLF